MAEQILAIDDPAGLLLEDMRQRALAAAQAVLEHYGVTVEECAAVGARPFKELSPGAVPNFFNGMGLTASTWLEADAVVREICGSEVRLRIVDRPGPLPH